MAEIGKLEVKKSSVEMELYWQIPNFLYLGNTCYSTPNFKFANTNGHLVIYPYKTNTSSPYVIALELKMENPKFPFDVRCTFAIKKADGLLIGIKSFVHTICLQNCNYKADDFFTRRSLQERASELMPANNLTIVCKLKHLDDSSMAALDTLSKNIKYFFTNKEFCDVTLQLQDKEFLAHKFILAARSPVFAAMFRHETSEKQTGIINIVDCEPESFQEFLEYLYSGKVENISCHIAPDLYKIADKYDVLELKIFCADYMRENLKIDNLFHVVLLAEEYEETNLLADAQSFFNRNLKVIFASEEWMAFLKKHIVLANKLLSKMASKVKVVE